ncbi:MAG: hypothetical protein ACREX8_00710 [Gammaproteobacteria bacterium]
MTTESIERWKAAFTNRTLQKYPVALHGMFKRAARVYGLPHNAIANVERPRLPRRAGIEVFSRVARYRTSGHPDSAVNYSGEVLPLNPQA